MTTDPPRAAEAPDGGNGSRVRESTRPTCGVKAPTLHHIEIKHRATGAVLFAGAFPCLAAAAEAAVLAGTDLGGADLRRADLTGANLGYGKLAGADLRGANLTRVNLYGADLAGADLNDAVLAYTKISAQSLPK
jgi:hypothetical protein